MTKYVLLGAAHWGIRSEWFRKFRCDHTIASNKFTTGEFAPNGLENFVAITLSQVTSLPPSFRSTLKTV